MTTTTTTTTDDDLALASFPQAVRKARSATQGPEEILKRELLKSDRIPKVSPSPPRGIRERGISPVGLQQHNMLYYVYAFFRLSVRNVLYYVCTHTFAHDNDNDKASGSLSLSLSTLLI